jgi:hypothetical protein
LLSVSQNTKKIHPKKEISLIISFFKKALKETKISENGIQLRSKKREMTQALYAHMNNKIIKKRKKKIIIR